MARQPAEVLRSERLRSRRRDVRRQAQRRRRRTTLSVLALVVMGIGGWTLAHSSLFGLDGIQVSGATFVSRAELIQASGVHVGQNLLSVHDDEVRARIERLPLVRSARVRRIATSRLSIVVVERVAAFVLQTVEGRWYLDDEGTMLGAARPGGPGLPTIVFSTQIAADPGDRVRAPAFRDAVRLWRALPSTLRAGGPVIEATSPTSLTLQRATMTIRFGTTEGLTEKLEAVRSVLDRVRRTGDRLVMLDVRSPSRPAATLA